MRDRHEKDKRIGDPVFIDTENQNGNPLDPALFGLIIVPIVFIMLAFLGNAHERTRDSVAVKPAECTKIYGTDPKTFETKEFEVCKKRRR